MLKGKMKKIIVFLGFLFYHIFFFLPILPSFIYVCLRPEPIIIAIKIKNVPSHAYNV